MSSSLPFVHWRRRVCPKTSQSSKSPNVKAAPRSGRWHWISVKGVLSGKERAVRKVGHTSSKGARSWVEWWVLWRLNGGQSLPSLFHSLRTSSLRWAGSILVHVANGWNTLEVTVGWMPILGDICSIGAMRSMRSMRSTLLSGMFLWGPSGSCGCVVGSNRSLVASRCPLNSCVGPMRSKIWSRRSTMIMVLRDHPLPSYLLMSPTWNMQI